MKFVLAIDQSTSATKAMLFDRNGRLADDPDRCVLFHCGNWANSFVPNNEIKTAPILGTTIGEENTYGAMAGRPSAGPLTYALVSTDEGQLIDTFGHRAVAHVPDLHSLMKHICKNGFEHHVAMSMGSVADALDEVITTYMGWENYHHL